MNFGAAAAPPVIREYKLTLAEGVDSTEFAGRLSEWVGNQPNRRTHFSSLVEKVGSNGQGTLIMCCTGEMMGAAKSAFKGELIGNSTSLDASLRSTAVERSRAQTPPDRAPAL